MFYDVILIRTGELCNLVVDSSQIQWIMVCVVSSRADLSRVPPTAIRAKMMAIGELQGPLTVTGSCKLVLKHYIVSTTHICPIGVIDLAGLFVP